MSERNGDSALSLSRLLDCEGIWGLSEVDKRASERIRSAQVDDSAQQLS